MTASEYMQAVISYLRESEEVANEGVSTPCGPRVQGGVRGDGWTSVVGEHSDEEVTHDVWIAAGAPKDIFAVTSLAHACLRLQLRDMTLRHIASHAVLPGVLHDRRTGWHRAASHVHELPSYVPVVTLRIGRHNYTDEKRPKPKEGLLAAPEREEWPRADRREEWC